MEAVTYLVGTTSSVLYQALAPAMSMAITVSGLHQLAPALDEFTSALSSPLTQDLEQWALHQLDCISPVSLGLAIILFAQCAFWLGRLTARRKQKVYILDFGVHKPDSRCANASPGVVGGASSAWWREACSRTACCCLRPTLKPADNCCHQITVSDARSRNAAVVGTVWCSLLASHQVPSISLSLPR